MAIISWIKTWWAERKARKAYIRRIAGYNMVIDALTSNEYTIMHLEDLVDSARQFGVYDDFDIGVEKAIADYKQHKGFFALAPADRNPGNPVDRSNNP